MAEFYYKQWKDAERDWKDRFENNWPDFSIKEIAQRGAGWDQGLTPVTIIPSSLDKLQKLRNYVGPLTLTSAYRSPKYNDKVSSTGEDGPHTTGQAFDIACFGNKANQVIYYAVKVGFTGIGVNQKGPYSGRFVHVDDLQDFETKGTRPWCWSY